MTARSYRSISLLISILLANASMVSAQEESVLRSTVARVTRLAFTESLPEADRIELFTLAVDWTRTDDPPQIDPKTLSKDRFLLRSFSGSIRDTENPYIDVDRHVTIRGNRCTAMLATWRNLKFRENGAFCHTPAYGLRIYRGDELLYETTICWQCNNFYVPDYDSTTGELRMMIYGFDDNPNARRLLKLFQQALPLEPDQKP